MVHLSAFADEISKDPVEQLDVLEQNGVRNIEFRSIHGVNVLDLSDAQHEEFRALLQRARVGLSAIGSPIGKIKIGEPFQPHLERFEKALALTEFYATPRIRIFSFYMPPAEAPDPYRTEVIARLSELTDRAESRGVSLLLENEKGIYGDTAAHVLDLLETINSPSLSHAFDPANYVEVGQSIDEAWRLLRTCVTHFHVKDYDAKTGKNVPTGEGQGQIPELLADAVEHGYEGFCVLEPHLIVAEKSYGFTGPERFGDAARAPKSALDSAGIAYS